MEDEAPMVYLAPLVINLFCITCVVLLSFTKAHHWLSSLVLKFNFSGAEV